ncbi:MAG: hypothetical protein JWM11_669 [Planctomycetaceae bacterium]|nr:hypothetical protein [Planctomycetaceae bacterium]
MKRISTSCSDCDSVGRRDFLKAVGGAAVAGSIGSGFWTLPGAFAGPSPKSDAETAVARLYASLSDEQRKTICFAFDNPIRQKINANWQITKPTIGGSFYTDAQQKLIDEIVRKVTSEDGYERLMKQMDHDSGGIGSYSVALFGVPGATAFEWELTGRHLTLRADGNSVDKAAFGGPIVYGHGEEDPKANLFYYQTKQVNEVFHALDPKQAALALVAKAPSEAAVTIQGDAGTFPGIAVSQLAENQRLLVLKTIEVLLAPYRKEDADEALEILKSSGGIEKLHMAFYQQDDLQNDKVWDIWRVEGPEFVWHFRGAPHVHAYINIGAVAQKPAPQATSKS